MSKKETLLSVQGLTKVFPGVIALDNIDFDLRKGEIHALVGENGAGKSTFAKILAGAYTPTKGDIYLNGRKVNIRDPLHALNLGIGMVYQERDLVPYFTAIENIFLGRELSHFGFICPSLMRKKVRDLMKEIGVWLEIDQPVSELGPSKQQMVEILKIMLLKPNISLKKRISIIFISHRLEEVFEISDRITVLRDGKKINTVKTQETSRNEIIKMMVAREIKKLYPKESAPIGDTILEVKNLSSGNLKEISFKVRGGEIVGFAGIVGCGRTELAETIFGLRRVEKGEIILEGKKVYPESPSMMIKRGVYLIPEDRRVAGLNLKMNVKENLSIIHLSKVCSRLFIDNRKEVNLAKSLVKKFGIQVVNVYQDVANLSGGNQQKVVIGKWLAGKAKVLIMDEATAGIDVGAKREIYKIMVNLAKEGIGIIFISSELPELIGMCDRIYVMNEGTITAEFYREKFSQQEILQCAVKDKKSLDQKNSLNKEE